MPESRENDVGNQIIREYILDQPEEDLVLIDIEADSTTKELQLIKNSDSSANLDCSAYHVQKILSNSNVMCGHGMNNRDLYPEMYGTNKGEKTIQTEERGLVLRGCVVDPRNYILRFVDTTGKECWLQFRPLTHTTVQIYTMEQWDSAITKIDQTKRGFKIAIALCFRKYIIAFVSLDNLCQIFWKTTWEELPCSQYPHVFLNFKDFLTAIAKWIQRRRGGLGVLKPKRRQSNALVVVRDSPIWHGVGVYTVSEIWHIAGLSPFLTEEEVFDSPSRTARLCCAFFSFAAIAHGGELWKFTKHHMYGYTIATSVKDRQEYMKFLHVWGKARTYVSDRHHQLLKDNPDGNGKYDAFEPELIRGALELLDINLGALIFGTKGDINWYTLSTAAGLQVTESEDSLTKHFRNITRLNDRNTHLNLSIYAHLFIKETEWRALAKHWFMPVLYRTKANSVVKDMWTLYFQQNPREFEMVAGEKYNSHLLYHLTQHTNIQTVGPLEFVGTGRVVSGSGKKPVIMICDHDPLVPKFYSKRRALEKETVKLKGKGMEHKGLNPIKKRKVIESLEEVHNSNTISGPTTALSAADIQHNQDNQEKESRPLKKIRRSADRDIAGVHNIYDKPSPPSRSVRKRASVQFVSLAVGAAPGHTGHILSL